MQGFRGYSDRLEATLQTLPALSRLCALEEVEEAAERDVPDELRRSVPRGLLKNAGAFFTSASLSLRTAALLKGLDCESCIVDPACGAGDLLVAYACNLPAEDRWTQTVESWSEKLFGLDLEAEFIRAARLRLHLAAWRATWKKTGSDPG